MLYQIPYTLNLVLLHPQYSIKGNTIWNGLAFWQHYRWTVELEYGSHVNIWPGCHVSVSANYLDNHTRPWSRDNASEMPVCYICWMKVLLIWVHLVLNTAMVWPSETRWDIGYDIFEVYLSLSDIQWINNVSRCTHDRKYDSIRQVVYVNGHFWSDANTFRSKSLGQDMYADVLKYNSYCNVGF